MRRWLLLWQGRRRRGIVFCGIALCGLGHGYCCDGEVEVCETASVTAWLDAACCCDVMLGGWLEGPRCPKALSRTLQSVLLQIDCEESHQNIQSSIFPTSCF